MSAPSTARVIPGVYWSAVCPACGRTVGISHAQPDLERPVPCACGGLAGYTWRMVNPEAEAETEADRTNRLIDQSLELTRVPADMLEPTRSGVALLAERSGPVPDPAPGRAAFTERSRALREDLEFSQPAPLPDPDPVPLGLVLDRPLVVFDLETTGVDVREARIVEFAFYRLRPEPHSPRMLWTQRLNPGIPIPPGATAVHGISDADVAGCKRFAEIADEVLEFLEGCDLCGFNIRSYDLKLLLAELARCGRTLDLAGLRLIDALSIYHRREPRNLTAAVKLYLGRDHVDAHGAEGDVFATLDVLAAQLERYDLPRTVGELHELFAPEGSIDLEGRFRLNTEGSIVFTFGKYQGQRLMAVARMKPDYLRWMLGQDFFDDTKAIIRGAL